jgi:hypothetical protein
LFPKNRTIDKILWGEKKYCRSGAGDTLQYGALESHAGCLRLQSHTQNVQYLSLFHCKSGCMKALQCYVRTYMTWFSLFIFVIVSHMKQQFVIIHTVHQTEFPRIIRQLVWNTPSVHKVCPQNKWFYLHFHNKLSHSTCWSIKDLSRFFFSVSCKILYRWVTRQFAVSWPMLNF